MSTNYNVLIDDNILTYVFDNFNFNFQLVKIKGVTLRA